MEKIKMMSLAPAAICVMLLGACDNMSTTEQRVLSGSAIGAGTGAVIGGVTGGSVGTGAVLGAGAGAERLAGDVASDAKKPG